MLLGGSPDKLEHFLLDMDNFSFLYNSRRFDLFFFWRALGIGDGGGDVASGVPSNVGARYASALERHKKVLTTTIASQFLDHDSRQDFAVQDAISKLNSKLGSFLCDLRLYEAATEMQKKALDIDHVIFNNMSRRVAESATALARTHHLQGHFEEASNMLFLVRRRPASLRRPPIPPPPPLPRGSARCA